VSLPLIIGNVGSWALQALLLTIVTGAALALVRATDPGLRLRAWHGSLAIALLLPFLQRWRIEAAAGSPSVEAAAGAARFAWEPWLAALVVAGIAARAVSVAAGLRQLRRLRLTATPWRPVPAWYRGLAADAGVSATLATSPAVDSAVTFGVVRPAILVPGRLLDAPEPHQRAIVAHELQHVARRDWLWVLAEEALLVALWWHPAIWFALGQARLAREEIVDRRTIAATGNRTGYLEALVGAADPTARGLVPGLGPRFYRRRQLFKRVRRLLEEETMSKARMLAAAAALAMTLPATVIGASHAFPLTAAAPAIASQDPPPPPPPPPARPRVQDDAPPPPPPPPPRPGAQENAPPPPPPPPPPRPVAQADAPPPPPPPPPKKKYELVTYSKTDQATTKAAAGKTKPGKVVEREFVDVKPKAKGDPAKKDVEYIEVKQDAKAVKAKGIEKEVREVKDEVNKQDAKAAKAREIKKDVKDEVKIVTKPSAKTDAGRPKGGTES
jgi:Zn-dependent protease with chaperone function